MSGARLGVAAVGAVLVLDQASKQLALDAFTPIDRVALLPFLDLTLAWNRGVSFGMFGSGAAPPYVFILIAIAISAFLSWQMFKAETRLAALGYALIIGGALGNIVDRAVYGAVIDFILLYWRDWRWPVFNVADMGITVGVCLILADSLWPSRDSPTS